MYYYHQNISPDTKPNLILTEGNILVVGDFLSSVMMVFKIGDEDMMVDGKTRCYMVLESRIKSFSYWSKTGDGNHIEKYGSYHPIGKMKCIGRSFPEIKGRDKHMSIIPWPNSQ